MTLPVIHYRRNQNTELSCSQLDENWDAVRDRRLHIGSQLSSTISDLYTTVENYDFITALQQCCTDLTNQLDVLQDSIFGDGELSVLITNLRNELLLQIAELQTDLNALTLRVTTTETSIATINSSLTSLSSSIVGLQNSKANINSPTFTGVPKAPTPLEGAGGTEIATVDYVNQFGTPIGVVLPYGGNSAPNANWLLAQGQAISRSTYAGLFSLFGTTYGAGDGSSTFNLPNLQQRVPVCVGGGYSLGATGGAATHTLTESEMPSHTHSNNHTHTVNDPGHTHYVERDSTPNDQSAGNDPATGDNTLATDFPLQLTTNSNTTGITINASSAPTGNTGGSAPHNNMQPYIVLNYIVKVK